MIRNILSDADSLIKEHFRGKGRLLVKLLVFQAFLIGVLTFLCLTRPCEDDIQSQANLGYFLHFKIKILSGFLVSVCGLLKYFIIGPLVLAQYLVALLMWILGCGKQEVLASFPLVKKMADVCLEKVDEDGKRKLLEAILLLIPSGLLTMLIKMYLGRSRKKDGETILLINNQSAAGMSSRDMSPVELVREYEMVEDMERIYAKMSTVADRGAQIVHRTAKGGVDMVAGAATKSGQIAKSAGRMAKAASEVPIEVIRKVRHWNHLSFTKLPGWMKDNEFLQFGHRPELNSVRECFKSIFGIHSETGNIWTHLIGFVAFVTMAIIFYVKPLCDQCHTDLALREKLIFLFFFIGAILCLGLSSLFHTLCCHSEHISKLFCKLDYVGISLLTVGSFVPWIYYGFYCQFVPKVVYLTIISVLGIAAIIVTMMDTFSLPAYRPVRAMLFVCLGGFGFVPSCHFLIMSGWDTALVEASIHRVLIMGGLYILGAVLYGSRIPERFMPGKCDIWFQSHQIFHVLVIAAAFVHFHGMQNMAVHRLTKAGACSDGGAYNSSDTRVQSA